MVQNRSLINDSYCHNIITLLFSKLSLHVIVSQQLMIMPFYFCIYMTENPRIISSRPMKAPHSKGHPAWGAGLFFCPLLFSSLNIGSRPSARLATDGLENFLPSILLYNFTVVFFAPPVE